VVQPKRKHRATGRKPPGGARPGAGRPPGSRNTLPLGAVSAIRALKLRVPKDAPEEHAELAGEALETVVDVMRGREKSAGLAFARLSAARAVREEICGKVTDKLEVTPAADAAAAVSDEEWTALSRLQHEVRGG
jgi:hypothetical protein